MIDTEAETDGVNLEFLVNLYLTMIDRLKI